MENSGRKRPGEELPPTDPPPVPPIGWLPRELAEENPVNPSDFWRKW